MSVELFDRLIKQAKYGKADKEWFPRWIRRYAETVRTENACLPVTRDSVIAFSRKLLLRKTQTWQRLQAVRAVEAYREQLMNALVHCVSCVVASGCG